MQQNPKILPYFLVAPQDLKGLPVLLDPRDRKDLPVRRVQPERKGLKGRRDLKARSLFLS